MQHYLCVDIHPSDPFVKIFKDAGWTVLIVPSGGSGEKGVDVAVPGPVEDSIFGYAEGQDEKLRHCMKQVRAPTILVMMEDWLLRHPVDGDFLTHLAETLTWRPNRINYVEMFCHAAYDLDFGGIAAVPFPGLHISQSSVLLPRMWEREYYLSFITEVIEWYYNTKETKDSQRAHSATIGRKDEGFSLTAYRLRDLYTNHSNFDAKIKLRHSGYGLVPSGSRYCYTHCDLASRMPINHHLRGFDYYHFGHGGNVAFDPAVCNETTFPGLAQLQVVGGKEGETVAMRCAHTASEPEKICPASDSELHNEFLIL